MSGIVLLGMFISFHLILILPSTLCRYNYAHFTNEETDTQIKGFALGDIVINGIINLMAQFNGSQP